MKNLTIYCKDFDLTDAIKVYAEEKMAHLYKYFNHDEEEISFNLRLGKVSNSRNQGKIFYAEVSVHSPEKNFGGRIEEEDIYAALDLLKDELARNIRDYKDKVRTLTKKDAQKFKQELHEVAE